MSYQVGCFHRRALGAALLIIAGIAPAAVRAADDSARRFQGGDAIEETVVLGRRQPYRGNVDIDDLPQATSRISAERLNALGITDLQRAMDLVSGVARQNGFGGLWDSFAIRGFAGDENLPSSYLVNGFNAGRGFSGKRDLSNVERLEVIKGPGSALYGRSEPGGTLNIVTKKPGVDSGGYLQVSAGRYDAGRLEGDWSGAPDARVAWRINGAYEEASSYRDHIDSKKLALTPSALVRLSDDLSLLYELEYIDQEIPFDRGLAVLDGVPRQPVSRFLGEPQDGPMDVDATGHQLTLERRLRDNWLLSVGVGMRRSSLTGWSSDTETSPGRQLLFQGGTSLNRQRRHRDYDADDLSARVEMSGAAQWLGLRHNLLLGVDAYDYEFRSIGQRWRTVWGSGDATYAIDILAPVYGSGGTRPNAGPHFNLLEEQRAEGLYLQDMVELAPDWRLQLGVRLDRFRQDISDFLNPAASARQSRNETSPRIGLVHELPDRTQLYLSYSEGFRPHKSDSVGNIFSPEKTDSLEVGVKWRSDRMDGTAALFRTEKSNILTADPADPSSGRSIALGRAESQGVEISLSARLSPDLELNFDYAYVDAETSNTVIDPVWGTGDTLPAGSRLINIPRHAGHLSLTRRGRLAGMPLSAGVSWRYVGERLGETITQDYDLASYQLLGLFARLELRDDLELRLTLDNAANERYDDNSYHRLWTMPGEPRSWGLSLRQTF